MLRLLNRSIMCSLRQSNARYIPGQIGRADNCRRAALQSLVTFCPVLPALRAILVLID